MCTHTHAPTCGRTLTASVTATVAWWWCYRDKINTSNHKIALNDLKRQNRSQIRRIQLSLVDIIHSYYVWFDIWLRTHNNKKQDDVTFYIYYGKRSCLCEWIDLGKMRSSRTKTSDGKRLIASTAVWKTSWFSRCVLVYACVYACTTDNQLLILVMCE